MVKSSCRAQIICLSVLVSLAALSGCAKPTAAPADFVGTWVSASVDGRPTTPGFETKLTLLPDGNGLQVQLPAPHAAALRWVVRGDRLIVTDRSSNTSVGYRYQFQSPDELALATDHSETVFRREPPAEHPAGAAPEGDESE